MGAFILCCGDMGRWREKVFKKMIEPNVELQMLKYHDLDLSVKALWLSRVTLGLLGLDCAFPYLDIFGYD